MYKLEACESTTTLTTQEVSHLEELPNAAHEVNQIVACELSASHEGPHHGLGQAQDPMQGADAKTVEHWVRWATAGQNELVVLEGCSPQVTSSDYSQICSLFAGHPGPHDLPDAEIAARLNKWYSSATM